LDEIKGKIARKSEFEGQLRVKLKKFKTKDLFVKGGIEEFTSLKVN
jgi:hypothetical protein